MSKKKKKDKEKKLDPKIQERELNNIDKNTLYNIASKIEESTHVDTVKKTDSDSFFRNVINNLFDKKDISTKTEYIGVRENFMGSKLTFLGKYANIPFMEKFIEVFEEKRVSLDRKGRKEILLALQERRQEIESQRNENLSRMFGV